MADWQSRIYTPEFQARRLEAFERDQHRCVACNHDGSEYRLECHHRTYENGGNPKLEDLYILCSDCHDLITDKMRRKRNQSKTIVAVSTTVEERARPVFSEKPNATPVDSACVTFGRPAQQERGSVKPIDYRGRS